MLLHEVINDLENIEYNHKVKVPKKFDEWYKQIDDTSYNTIKKILLFASFLVAVEVINYQEMSANKPNMMNHLEFELMKAKKEQSERY